MSFFKKENGRCKLAKPTYGLTPGITPYFFGTKGSLTLLALPWVAVLGLLVFAGSRVALRSQASVALDARLDTCVVRAVEQRESLYRSLVQSNSALTALQATIVALRAGRLVPGVGVLAGLSESELVAAANALAKTQEAEVVAAMPKDAAVHVCAGSAYSRSPATCPYALLAPSDFSRARSPLPDVPGTLQLRQGGTRLVSAVCQAPLQRSLHQRRATLSGSPQLASKDFHYAYE